MPRHIYPPSFECDCGYQLHFSERTVREMQQVSRRKRAGISEGAYARLLFALSILALSAINRAQADPPDSLNGKNIFDFGSPGDPPLHEPATRAAPTATTQPVAPAAVAPASTAPAVASAGPVKLPVPAAAEQADASKLIDELFAGDIAKATMADQKLALSAKFLQAGVDEKTDMAGKFVLLQRAKEMAVSACDLAAAFTAIDAMNDSFQINAPKERVDAANAIAKSPHTDRKLFVTQAQSLVDAAQSGDDYDLAKQLADLALSSARLTKDQELIQQAMAQVQEVTGQRDAYVKVAPAEAALKSKANDPDANLKVGRFRCFLKGDWDSGLHNLALASDGVLSALAKQELTEPSSAADQVSLGDGWWRFAATEVGTTKKAAMERAGKWYREAKPQLTGLIKARTEKRIAQIEEIQSADNPAGHRVVELLKTMKGDTSRTDGGAIVLEGAERISTDRTFRVPATFRVLVMTDSTNVRIAYAADQIIFNWEVDQNQLRIDGGPASGRHKRGAGKIPVNQWVEIVLRVLPDSLAISVDGQPRYQTQADFSAVDQPFSIRPSSGSVIRVKSVSLMNP